MLLMHDNNTVEALFRQQTYDNLSDFYRLVCDTCTDKSGEGLRLQLKILLILLQFKIGSKSCSLNKQYVNTLVNDNL